MQTLTTSRSRYYMRGNKIYYTYHRTHRIQRKPVVSKNAILIIVCAILAALMVIVFHNIFALYKHIDHVNVLKETVQYDVEIVEEEIDDIKGTIPTYKVQTLEQTRGFDMVNVDPVVSNTVIEVNGHTLRQLALPSAYYGSIDFSSFQPYESYLKITNKKSPSYAITHGELAYTDSNGLRRYITTEDQYTVDGMDDYIVALGTFYKPKGTAGQRYLVETETGSFTIIAGDEKADNHTDQMNMFTSHKNGNAAGIIEWIVDTTQLPQSIKSKGTVTAGPLEFLKGKIIGIYQID